MWEVATASDDSAEPEGAEGIEGMEVEEDEVGWVSCEPAGDKDNCKEIFFISELIISD